MSKSFKAMWLGDTDPNAQIIHIGDLRFVKGETTDVPADHEHAEMLRGNPLFAVDGTKADTTEAHEPSAEELESRAEEGTEKGALKTQLRSLGHDVKGNPSVETLRNRLVDATK
ncbi:MAG TPA: hypothetical protein VF637_15320 [Sphingomicrobium sp.]